jgi:hypothetical protein
MTSQTNSIPEKSFTILIYIRDVIDEFVESSTEYFMELMTLCNMILIIDMLRRKPIAMCFSNMLYVKGLGSLTRSNKFSSESTVSNNRSIYFL